MLISVMRLMLMMMLMLVSSLMSYCLLHKHQTGEYLWSLLRMQLIHTRLVVLINATMTKERVLIFNLYITR